VADLRNVFSKCGGNLGESGSVAWMFDAKGVVTISADASDEDSVITATLDAGAEDVRTEDDTIQVTTRPEDLQAVREALSSAGIPFIEADISMMPKSTVRVEGSKEASQVLRLMEMLEDLDDVQNVYANFDIPDEIMQESAA
jgi:transcriptional/translational regulatory protein YebC/TACO1